MSNELCLGGVKTGFYFLTVLGPVAIAVTLPLPTRLPFLISPLFFWGVFGGCSFDESMARGYSFWEDYSSKSEIRGIFGETTWEAFCGYLS